MSLKPVDYAIGIDLGTTHSALSYQKLSGANDVREGRAPAPIETLPIRQHTGPGMVEERLLLPSFLYLPHANETEPDAEQGVPIPGEWAKRRSATVPTRVVSSAKSWLCHSGVDRRGALLPPDAPEDVVRMSPLAASTRILCTLRDSWDSAHPEAPLAAQAVTLTVPASFDPAARDFTVEAARAAGFRDLTLLEEPQAALYQWLARFDGSDPDRDWRRHLAVADTVLVVDVGGGTTDFSLVEVLEEDGVLALHRLAVGEHILLGGDNMDLALAHLLKQKLERSGSPQAAPLIDRWQLRALAQACRAAKEALFADPTLTRVPVTIPARGSKLVMRVTQTELLRDELERILLDGFFQDVSLSARPSLGPLGTARSAVSELGLPYAKDPAILSHLAAFLTRQAPRKGADGASGAAFLAPTAILFNGGVFHAALLRERVHAVVNQWLAEAGQPPARILEGADYDFACARGACHYGAVSRGGGVRIRAGLPRSFYLGIDAAVPAIPGVMPPVTLLCLAPKGLEPSAGVSRLPQDLALVVGRPVRFRFFSAGSRAQDKPGAAVDLEDARAHAPFAIQEHAPLEVTLPPGSRAEGTAVPVRLAVALNDVGTLELNAEAIGTDERWRVSFNASAGSEGLAAAAS